MKILLVDDALDMRLVMKRTLTLMGHDVTVAEDGEAAWELLQQDSFQVVITDWVMPRLDGPGLCRRIRESSFPHYLYIIMLTGLSGKPNLIAGMDAGADDFTNKPIERDEVEVLLRAAERVISLESKLEQQNESLAEANRSLQKTQDEVQQDLRHAAVLQKGILPGQKQVGNLDFAWFYRPASFIGGDTFNYFPLDEDTCLFYTVDVSGHGISSALLSMYLSNLLTSAGNGANHTVLTGENHSVGSELSQLVTSFNEHLQDVLDFSEHYFTMILGVINTRKQQLHFVQAGHPKPFLIDTAAAQVTELDCTGFPVGLIPQAEYEAVSFDFPPGSRLVLFSDGLFELTKPGSGTLYSEEDLATEMRDSAHLSATEAINQICDRWALDNSVIEQPDDLSLLIVDSKA
ncbi:MAG: PP2C family protein-serine/threonine phosphatase [Thiolinea sp.]